MPLMLASGLPSGMAIAMLRCMLGFALVGEAWLRCLVQALRRRAGYDEQRKVRRAELNPLRIASPTFACAVLPARSHEARETTSAPDGGVGAALRAAVAALRPPMSSGAAAGPTWYRTFGRDLHPAAA